MRTDTNKQDQKVMLFAFLSRTTTYQKATEKVGIKITTLVLLNS